MRVSEDIHEAYQKALEDVWYSYDYQSSPRNQPIREILDYSFKVLDPVAEPIITKNAERNVTIKSYTEKEVELYNSGTNKVEDFAKASKFWNKLANPNGTVNSAYGHLIWFNKSLGNPMFQYNREFLKEEEFESAMRTPWEYCVDTLKADKDSRQAVLKFNLPEHAWKGNKDFPCTMYGIFHIRDDELHFSVKMRSNDLMRGLVYDLPWFISLMDKMVTELQETYPNLTKGVYTHHADSMHIYEKDKETILKMMGK